MLALWHLFLISEPCRAVQVFLAHHSCKWYLKERSALFFLELFLRSDIVSSGLYQTLLFFLPFPWKGRPGRFAQFLCVSGPVSHRCIMYSLVPKYYLSLSDECARQSPRMCLGIFIPPSRGTGLFIFSCSKENLGARKPLQAGVTSGQRFLTPAPH